jgi:ferrochelatase
LEACRRHLCAAFVANCLETIEEIGMRAREIFLSHGGTGFHLVACLNDPPAWIRAVRQLAEERIAPPGAATSQPDTGRREGHAKTQRHEGTGREAPEFR